MNEKEQEKFSQPIALITGASGGIGSAIARRLAGEGYPVILQYHQNQTAAFQLKQEIIAAGGNALALPCDLTSLAQIQTMFDTIKNQWGEVGVLINNAAISRQELFTDMTEENWQEMWQTNVSSAIWCSKLALPAMISRKTGKIINISSIWGMVGASCEVAYSATKGALISFTKALAKEVGPSGIAVNCIAPGVIDTPMNSHLAPEDLDALREETPLGAIGSPQDVAALVSFLLSSGGDFITGQVISPNGGFVIV